MRENEALSLLKEMKEKHNVETYEDISNMLISLRNMLIAFQKLDTVQDEVEKANIATASALLDLTANVIFQCDEYFRQ